MKKLFCLLVSSLIIPFAQAADSKKVHFDNEKSYLTWTGKKVTGSHSGRVFLKEGSGEILADNSVRGSFVVNLASIKVDDITDPKDNAKLVGHLTSDDFFNVPQFPISSFTVTNSTPIAGSESELSITGKLAILGVENEITFPAKVSLKDGVVTAEGKTTFDRTRWNLRYGSGKFFAGLGDKVIYDDIAVEIHLVGAVAS